MNLDDGKIISDIVEDALRSGDFSRLRDIGPAVQQAIASAIVGKPGSRSSDIPTTSYTTRSTPTSGASTGGASTSGASTGRAASGSTPINSAPARGASASGAPAGGTQAYGTSTGNAQAYSTATSRASTGSSATSSRPIGSGQAILPPQEQSYYPPPQGRAIQTSNYVLRQLYNSKAFRVARSIPQIVLSSIGAFLFGVLTLAFLVSLPSMQEYFAATLVLTIASAIPTSVCIGLLTAGINNYKMAERVINLASMFQRKSVYTFDELVAETGYTPKQIRKDLRKARAKGMLPEMRIDDEDTYVMWGEEAYRHYSETKNAYRQKAIEAEERKRRLLDPVTADIEHFRSEGEATVHKIRTANDAIPGEEISAKLDVLEATTGRIFLYVERYPHKLPDTRKFMSYYLPTTLKLVEKYRQFDEMDYQPANVQQAKLDIEYSLDIINEAFVNLLESLFEHETIDVATDIDVLKKMLEQEGLTNKEFRIDPPMID